MAQAKVPQDLRYTVQHEWVRVEGNNVTIGITDFAQHALGEVTYVELPAAGAKLTAGKEFAVVESLKAASDVFSPVSGTVAEANSSLEDSPKLVNDAPYGAGWLCKLTDIDKGDLDTLLTPAQYSELLAKEEG